MTFCGFDPEDGAPLYDTKEAAIERTRQLIAWGNDPDAKIMVLRDKRFPLWLAHLLQGTWFEGLAYRQV